MDYTQDQIDRLIIGIYKGLVDVTKLPVKLYKACFDYLFSGVELGAKDYLDKVMMTALKKDVHLFSAAKTFNYVLETKGLIVEGSKILPLAEFKKRAKDVFGLYYDTWLETEYATALNQSASIRNWQEVVDSPYELVQYQTVGDRQVSDICRQYDGLIYPKDHPIWQKISPLNHYRCRCLLKSVDSGRISSKKYSDFENEVPSGFDRNAYYDKKIYPANHPYYDVPKKYSKLAKRNFDLPID